MEGRVLSGDSHIDLRFMPENTFIDNAPANLKSRMPHIEQTAQGLRWVADGTDLGVVGIFVTETQSTEMNERTRLMREGGFFDDQDIAAILTYVRAAWGKTTAPVTSEAVEKVRTQTREGSDSWTVEELLSSP